MNIRRKIVILEDDENFSALLTAALEEEFEVVVGHNGLQGVAACLEGGIAAVVTDIGMPELDGLAMLKEFSRDPRLSAIPVLIVTATHFRTLNRNEVLRFPQVKRVFSKTESVEVIAAGVKSVLREMGVLPPGA